MPYSEEIPDEDRAKIEEELDDAAGRDIDAQLAGMLGLLGIKAVVSTNDARELACTVCEAAIGYVLGVTNIEGRDVVIALPTEALSELLGAMVLHVVERHTAGWDPVARIILLAKNASKN